jgi:hypothetical protein
MYMMRCAGLLCLGIFGIEPAELDGFALGAVFVLPELNLSRGFCDTHLDDVLCLLGQLSARISHISISRQTEGHVKWLTG